MRSRILSCFLQQIQIGWILKIGRHRDVSTLTFTVQNQTLSPWHHHIVVTSFISHKLCSLLNLTFFAGERPYKCHIPECGRAFIQLSNLQQHLRNHESQIERLKNRPFHCNICGKGFATESSLRTHTGKVSREMVMVMRMRRWCITELSKMLCCSKPQIQFE